MIDLGVPVLGSGSFDGPAGVTVERVAPTRLRLRATADLAGLATGRFAAPSAGVTFAADAWPTDLDIVGFAFTQFALPVTAGRELDFDFHPAPDLRSPRAVWPLIARSAGRIVLLAPIDHPHEHLIAVADDGIVWGWHGDLDTVPDGFATTLGVYEATSVTEALAAWRADLRLVDHPRIHPVLTHLSYWTDNGAAYWYRTEPGRTIAESVVDAVDGLRADGIPIGSVELDSWAYPHATARPIAEIGYPAEVPPTGALEWSPRPDAFPPGDGDPIERFRDRIGAPLVMHARHIAPDSPYVDDPDDWWVDRSAAHPVDPEFFRRWFDDARRWGVTCIEQDWMLMYWFGVRQLRAAPGRAAGWQRTLARLGDETDIDLIWCMATPADMVLAAELERVVAVRTCDDYRFADDPAFLWTWFLTVNRLADTLGLTVFKDCFFSMPEPGDDPIDGDRHAELEALLAALSGGPVGLGDRIGRTDRDVVRRTCDADGRLRRVDGPIAAVDDCLFGGPARGEGLMWATTTATTDHGTWRYVLAINTAGNTADDGAVETVARDADTIADRFELGAERDWWDWRSARSGRSAVLTADLAPRDWALFVVAPDGAPPIEEVGDVTKYVAVESGGRHERDGGAEPDLAPH